MEEMVSNIVKVLSHTILVHIYSYPQFAIELFLACVVCIVHCLLIIEVNRVYYRINAKAAARLRMRHTPLQEIEKCSFHTISRLQTQIFPQTIEATTMKHSFYSANAVNKRLNRKISNTSNFGWIVSHGEPFVKHRFEDRLEKILSISPSEYVRKDKAKKCKEADLKCCIQSLTSLLDLAEHDNILIKDLSKDVIKRSIETLQDNFDNPFSRDGFIGEFHPQLHNIIGDSLAKKSLQNALESFTPVNESVKKKKSQGVRNTSSSDLISMVALAESSSQNLNNSFTEDIVDYSEND